MISQAEIIATHLIAQGIFTNPSAGSDWPLYVSNLPDSDEVNPNAAVVYDTQGVLDGRYMSNGEYAEHYGFQIRARAQEYNEGWAKIQAAVTELIGMKNINVVVDSVTYTVNNASQFSNIIPLKSLEQGITDTKRLDTLVVNFMTTITEV